MAANFVAKLFLPPEFPDEAQTLAGRKLWAVVLGLFVSISLLFPLLSWSLPGTAARACLYVGVFDGQFILVLGVARFGWIRLASALLITLAVITLGVSAWTAGGVRAPGMMGYLVMIGIAGILQGPIAATLTGAISAAIALFLLMAERRGFLPAPSVHHTPTTIWFVLVFCMAEFVVIQLVVNWAVRRAEERAAASSAARGVAEEKFTKLFRASPDAIVVTDLTTGEILEANPRYEQLFGYSRAELIGRTSVELGIFEDSRERQRMVQSIGAHGGVRDWEMQARDRHGARIPLQFSGELLELGGRTLLVSIIHDLTASKQAEAREHQSRNDFARLLLASQETERRRIAGELHDSLGQNLILIKNRAQGALEAAAEAPGLGAHFQALQEMAATAIAEVRQISHALRPHQLDQLGLTRALEAMIESTAESSQIPIERKLDPVDDLFTSEAATHLYRVAQETLSNILKHASARHVTIALERDLRDVRLWIEDDGRGFAGPAGGSGRPAGGLGLGSIAERVRILGGTLKIDSSPGLGTRVEVVVPHAGVS